MTTSRDSGILFLQNVRIMAVELERQVGLLRVLADVSVLPSGVSEGIATLELTIQVLVGGVDDYESTRPRWSDSGTKVAASNRVVDRYVRIGDPVAGRWIAIGNAARGPEFPRGGPRVGLPFHGDADDR